MQKSVLVPIEKYQRLLERSTTNNSDTRDAATETDRFLGTPEEEKTEETTEATAEEESSANPIEVSGRLDNFKTPKKSIKKRQRRSRPPGIKDYKSMWLKLNGRL